MALTPVQSLYDAFLVLIESDEWDALEEFQAQIDFKQLALAAKPWFKFPRCSLDIDEEKQELKQSVVKRIFIDRDNIIDEAAVSKGNTVVDLLQKILERISSIGVGK